MAENKPDIGLIPSEQKRRGFARATSLGQKKQPLGNSFRLLLGLLILLVIASAGLFYWTQSLNGEKESLEIELRSIRAEKDAAAEEEIVELDNIIRSFKLALSNHRLWSELFNVVEDLTVQGITFISLEANYKTGTITLQGLSENYNLLAQQVKSFESENNVMRVDVPTVKINNVGLVDFNMIVTVKKSVFK